ncbi:ABC transporter ATP-binding protein [Paenibacillus sambharensis]|uniref:ABC transporter ATP-binding protein n=1 Tax=Paenibacillus sambharensis TaxID=1803190 RepID=A0A2W1LSE3_9BACL|nr:ABC transporter ATP-binding protein [Paenibacillus sambharensis]PZD97695.1 ABC transporter ATP-binding protein [Paenibacillus sambharensis]
MNPGGIPSGRHAPIPKFNPRSIASMLLRLFSLTRSNWRLLIAAVISMTAVSLLEFVIPQLTRYVIDHVIPADNYAALPWVAGGILGAALLLGLFGYIGSTAMASVGQKAIYELRNMLYRHLQTLDMSFYDRNRTGDLMSRVTSDVNMLQQLVSSSMIQLFTDIFTFTAVAIYMLWIDWQLTLMLLATFPIMIYTTRRFSTRIRSSFRTVQQSVADVSDHLQDTLSGIRLIKSFSTEDYESDRFADRSRVNMEANLKTVRLRAIYEPTIDFINFLGLAIVLVLGAWQVMSGRLTIGSVVAFMAYLRLLQNPVRHFSRILNTVQQSAAAYERVVDILETKPEVADRDGASQLPPIQGRVVYQDVDFGYTGHPDVLHQLNLEMGPGQVTALVGSSGSGKTTIAHLLTRFYDVRSGSVSIDGFDVRDVTVQSLRQQIGLVSQDIMLFNGTIRDNIRYGRQDATEEETIAASAAANAHGFITAFPDGYDAEIGERGVKLSGGQKQRISIARALLKNPRLIILDEATAALDTESEHLIQEALNRLLQGRTCLVIAHRLSTIRHADQIVVLEEGRILERGTHDELLKANGRYARLYELQFPQHNPIEQEAGDG